jgi:hypothetical protein
MANNSQTFTCETCNKIFDSRQELGEHSINEHEGKKGISGQEELTFSSKYVILNSLHDKILSNIALNNMKADNNTLTHMKD